MSNLNKQLMYKPGSKLKIEIFKKNYLIFFF